MEKTIIYFDHDCMIEAAQFVAELVRQGFNFKAEMEGKTLTIQIFGY